MINFFKTILSAVFPEQCFVCGKKDETLCAKCFAGLPRGFSPEENTLALLDYGDRRVKKAIKLFKYGNRRALASLFAGLIYENALLEELSEWKLLKNFKEPLLIPIPISPKRLRERGYNQTELICSELQNLDEGRSFSFAKNILIKVRDTPSQVKAGGKKERLKNLSGSFAVKDGDKIHGRNVILLDDVTTTGATIAEARRALKKAGVKRILSVVIAH